MAARQGRSVVVGSVAAAVAIGGLSAYAADQGPRPTPGALVTPQRPTGPDPDRARADPGRGRPVGMLAPVRVDTHGGLPSAHLDRAIVVAYRAATAVAGGRGTAAEYAERRGAILIQVTVSGGSPRNDRALLRGMRRAAERALARRPAVAGVPVRVETTPPGSIRTEEGRVRPVDTTREAP